MYRSNDCRDRVVSTSHGDMVTVYKCVNTYVAYVYLVVRLTCAKTCLWNILLVVCCSIVHTIEEQSELVGYVNQMTLVTEAVPIAVVSTDITSTSTTSCVCLTCNKMTSVRTLSLYVSIVNKKHCTYQQVTRNIVRTNS